MTFSETLPSNPQVETQDRRRPEIEQKLRKKNSRKAKKERKSPKTNSKEKTNKVGSQTLGTIDSCPIQRNFPSPDLALQEITVSNSSTK